MSINQNHPEAVPLAEGNTVSFIQPTYKNDDRMKEVNRILGLRPNDYFGILKVDEHENESAIRKAFGSISKDVHPDKHNNHEDAKKAFQSMFLLNSLWLYESD